MGYARQNGGTILHARSVVLQDDTHHHAWSGMHTCTAGFNAARVCMLIPLNAPPTSQIARAMQEVPGHQSVVGVPCADRAKPGCTLRRSCIDRSLQAEWLASGAAMRRVFHLSHDAQRVVPVLPPSLVAITAARGPANAPLCSAQVVLDHGRMVRWGGRMCCIWLSTTRHHPLPPFPAGHACCLSSAAGMFVTQQVYAYQGPGGAPVRMRRSTRARVLLGDDAWTALCARGEELTAWLEQGDGAAVRPIAPGVSARIVNRW